MGYDYTNSIDAYGAASEAVNAYLNDKLKQERANLMRDATLNAKSKVAEDERMRNVREQRFQDAMNEADGQWLTALDKNHELEEINKELVANYNALREKYQQDAFTGMNNPDGSKETWEQAYNESSREYGNADAIQKIKSTALTEAISKARTYQTENNLDDSFMDEIVLGKSAQKIKDADSKTPVDYDLGTGTFKLEEDV